MSMESQTQEQMDGETETGMTLGLPGMMCPGSRVFGIRVQGLGSRILCVGIGARGSGIRVRVTESPILFPSFCGIAAI